MPEDFDSFDENEQLKVENDFLKAKLMLEHGAQFGEIENNRLPAEIENEFLNNIIAFEKQFDERKRIKVFDKIGRPRHFKAVNEIPDNEIDNEWKGLLDYLNDHQVDLRAYSPNILPRELYRFTTEELFEYEMDDLSLPGWTTNFIYDEFYPDAVYENSRSAVQDCINYFLRKASIDYLTYYKEEGLRLNQHSHLTQERLLYLVNQFKNVYDEIELSEDDMEIHCTVGEDTSTVTGKYSLIAVSSGSQFHLSGNWNVDFVYDKQIGFWEIANIQIEGINF